MCVGNSGTTTKLVQILHHMQKHPKIYQQRTLCLFP